MLSYKKHSILFVLACSAVFAQAQCLSSANPVGGIENLMVQEKGSLRFIAFYKYAQSDQYYEGDDPSDYTGISKGYYNFASFTAGYGLLRKLTLEARIGYFLNKSQVYSIEPPYTLSGHGISNVIADFRYGLYTNHVKRIYFSAGAGIKIPGSRKMKEVDNVELPWELQPSTGAYGLVFYASWVKEIPEPGLRFFLTQHTIVDFMNRDEYTPGAVFYNSFYASKHLMFPWLKGDWTCILQVRNEIRTPDKRVCCARESTGSVLFFLAPQLNYVWKDKWNVSLITDFPVYQYFRGTQLGAGWGITLSLARTISKTTE